MARSRRSSRTRSRSKARYDWVVNEDTYGEFSNITVPNGSIAAVPLTYPKGVTAQDFLGPGQTRGSQAWPDAGRQYVKAVRGWYRLGTTTWASGNGINAVVRVVKKPMDWASLAAITDVAYSLFDAQYANERFVYNRLHWDVYVAGTSYATTFPLNIRVNQWLEPDEALYIVMHNESGATQSLNFAHFHRTLMLADG